MTTMKASQVVEALQKFIAEYGDLVVEMGDARHTDEQNSLCVDVGVAVLGDFGSGGTHLFLMGSTEEVEQEIAEDDEEMGEV